MINFEIGHLSFAILSFGNRNLEIGSDIYWNQNLLFLKFNIKMESYIQATIGMLAVINPFVCGTMLLQIEQGTDNGIRSKAAVKSMLTVLIILLAAALGGRYVLNAFGISMDAFKIVGGIVLGFIGFQMLAGSNTNSNGKKANLNEIIMFAASPGTIAMVITLA